MLSTSWFDIKSFNYDESNINFEDYLKNKKILDKFIKNEKSILKNTNKIFLGGFS